MDKCKGTISKKDFEKFFSSVKESGLHYSYPSKEWLVLQFRKWGLHVEGYRISTRNIVIEIVCKEENAEGIR